MNMVQQIRSSANARRLFPLYGIYRRSCAEADDMGRRQRSELLAHRMRRVERLARRSGVAANDFTTKLDLRRDPTRYRRRGLGPVSRAATGGTTGVPLELYRSITNVVFEQATIDHIIGKHGVDAASARVAVFRGDNIKSPDDQTAPFWRGTPRYRVFSSIHLNRTNAREIGAALGEFRPDVLYCYPSSLCLLLEYARDGLLEPAPRLVVTSSEHLDRSAFSDVRSIMGCPLLDYYGQAERVCFASSSPNGNYRFRHDYGAVLLDRRGEEDRLFGTCFHNDKQLFYRYDTEDTILGASLLDEDHRRLVELGLEDFDGIKGRAGEEMDLPDGRRIVGFNQIPRNVHGLDSVQFIRTGDWSIDVLVVRGISFSDDTLGAVMKNLKLKVPSDVKTRFVFSDAPHRSRSGKALVYIDARAE